MRRSSIMFKLVEKSYRKLGLTNRELLKLLKRHFNHRNNNTRLIEMDNKDLLFKKMGQLSKRKQPFRQSRRGQQNQRFCNLATESCEGQLSFIPKTFIIERKNDFNKLQLSTEDKDKIWFFKPNSSRGIIVDHYENIKNTYNEKKGSYVLQERIKPLLINKKKFNIRCYILIFGEKKQMYFYKDGYIFIATTDYDPNNFSEFVQIANRCVNCRHRNYNIKKQAMFFKKETFEHYDILYPQILNILKNVYQVYQNKLENINDNYIVGVDILVDENKKCWLLEMNFDAAIYLYIKYLYDNLFEQFGKDIISLYSELYGFKNVINKDNKLIKL